MAKKRNPQEVLASLIAKREKIEKERDRYHQEANATIAAMNYALKVIDDILSPPPKPDAGEGEQQKLQDTAKESDPEGAQKTGPEDTLSTPEQDSLQ